MIDLVINPNNTFDVTVLFDDVLYQPTLSLMVPFKLRNDLLANPERERLIPLLGVVPSSSMLCSDIASESHLSSLFFWTILLFAPAINYYENFT